MIANSTVNHSRIVYIVEVDSYREANRAHIEWRNAEVSKKGS